MKGPICITAAVTAAVVLSACGGGGGSSQRSTDAPDAGTPASTATKVTSRAGGSERQRSEPQKNSKKPAPAASQGQSKAPAHHATSLPPNGATPSGTRSKLSVEPHQVTPPAQAKHPTLEKLVDSGGSGKHDEAGTAGVPEGTSDQAVEALRRMKEEAHENAGASDKKKDPVKQILDQLAEAAG